MLQLGLPGMGSLMPSSRLVYNSLRTVIALSDAAGRGITDRFTTSMHIVFVPDPPNQPVPWGLVETPCGIDCYCDWDDDTESFTSPTPGVSNSFKSGSSMVATQPNGLKLHYDDTTEYLTKLTSPSGNIWTMTRSGTPSKLSTITDPAGRLVTYSYDGNDKLSKITDYAGRETNFTVDANDNLVTMISAEQCQTEMLYDDSHRLTGHIDPAGNRTTYTYDAFGRVTCRENALGQCVTLAYSTSGADIVTAVTNSLGQTSTMVFGEGLPPSWATENLKSVTNPLGQISTYTWRKNRLISAQNPAGQITTYVYKSTPIAGDRLEAFV